MSLVYRALVDSGLPVSWNTILCGWRGVGSGFYGCKLTAQDVIDIVADRLGTGTEEQDRLTALLANEDPADWQTIGRYLEELSFDEPTDEVLEATKWRLAELRLLLDVGVKAVLATAYDPQLEVADLFGDFWRSYCDSLGSSEAFLEALPNDWCGQPIDKLILAHRSWAEREQVTLVDLANV